VTVAAEGRWRAAMPQAGCAATDATNADRGLPVRIRFIVWLSISPLAPRHPERVQCTRLVRTLRKSRARRPRSRRPPQARNAAKNGRPATFDINIFNFCVQSGARTWHVVSPTCRAGHNYMAYRKNYKALGKSFHGGNFPRKPAWTNKKRAAHAVLCASALQR